MSRGFVKEDDQEEIPMVLPRAHLPEGVANYVTQVGMDELMDEKQMLLNSRDNLENRNEKEQRIESNHINAKLELLNERISTAKIVDFKKQPQNKIGFGAMVTLKVGDKIKPQQYQIVGVDEADISKDKISFISPIARILINKKVGEKAIFKLPKEERIFEIIAITY